jgi:hypothetical protein
MGIFIGGSSIKAKRRQEFKKGITQRRKDAKEEE